MQKKRVAFFDVDRTMYDGALFFDVLQEQTHRGWISDEAQDALEVVFNEYKQGEIAYEPAMAKILTIHAKTLTGYESEMFLALAKQVCQSQEQQFYSYVRPLIGLLRPTHDIAIVTGEPQYVARAVGEMFGIGYYFSSRYETRENAYTGKVQMQLAYRHEKTDAIKKFLADHTYDGSFAFGDSAGDIAMLDAVEHAICLHPSVELQRIAYERQWHQPTDKTVVTLVKSLLY